MIQADIIGRGGHIADPVHAGFHVGHQFVHSRHDDDVGRAEGHAGNPVAGAVYIHQLSVQRNGVGTHEEVVAHIYFRHELLLLFGSGGAMAVQERVAGILKRFHHTAFFQRHGTSPGDDRRGGHEIHGFCDRVL